MTRITRLGPPSHCPRRALDLPPILAALPLLAMSVLHAAVPPPTPKPPVPTAKQLAWQRLELTMFVHFGINTFTNREWGTGSENPDLFRPSDLDARQWARTAREAGFKLMILTAKHHDGFCLWPTRQTDHCVRSSPWRHGKGDVVKEFADACRAEGLKVGLYLSPWDRHQPTYGDSPRYNDFFVRQLTELLTTYGPVDEVWFDGACGEGPNGKRQAYDWKSYYDTVYRINPNAVIAICGPDIRWVGNESGVAKPNESSVRPGRSGNPKEKIWYPAECDVSIRPGWFYHPDQDAKVKSLDHLLDIYFKSVGRNSVLLLNVPPDKRGRFAEPDVQRLRQFRQVLDQTFAVNLAADGHLSASNVRGRDPAYAPENMLDKNLETAWATDDDVGNARVEWTTDQPRTFNVICLQEDIRFGERVRHFKITMPVKDTWHTLAEGNIIGHKRLLRIPRTSARRLRLEFQADACPVIAEFGLYLCPRDSGFPTASLAAHKPVKVSNVHPGGTCWGGDKAVDDDEETRWATADPTRECWLEVDLLKPETIGRISIRELTPRITRFRIEVRNSPEEPWQTAYEHTKAGKHFSTNITPIKARFVRLHILEATFAPTIWEFGLYPPKT